MKPGLRHQNKLDEGGTGAFVLDVHRFLATPGAGAAQSPSEGSSEGHSELCSAAFKKLASGGVGGPAVNPKPLKAV